MKKSAIIFAVLICSQLLFAKKFSITCDYIDIPEVAKGVYIYDTDNCLINYTTPDHQLINVGGLLRDNSIGRLIHAYNDRDLPGAHETDFFIFDKKGNAYILLKNWYSDGRDSIYILKYNPVENKLSYINPNLKIYPGSIAVSDDGSWIFVTGCKDYSLENGAGIPVVLAFPADNPSNYEELISFQSEHGLQKMFINLCFDSNTNNLYFYNLGWDWFSDVCTNQGVYIVKPDSKGKYSSTGVERFVFPDMGKINDYVRYDLKINSPNHSFAVNAIKSLCGLNVDVDKIEISLAYFKSMKDSRFADLYCEDSNGNPLTDSQAIEHLYVKNNDLFNNYCWDYERKSSNFEYNNTPFPLEKLCLLKKTGKSAVTGDRTFMQNRGFQEHGYIFSNDDGVWINGARWSQGKGLLSQIIQLTDKNGNIVTEIDENLSSIYLKTIANRDLDIYVGKDFIVFLPEDNHTIYLYKQNKLQDLAHLFPDVTEFTKEQLYSVYKTQSEESKMVAVSALKDDNSAAEKETEKASDKSQKLVSAKIVIILSILLAVTIVFLIILLITTVIIPSVNRTLLDKIHLFRIKKDKKFIFDIQETERGKISRDIHDSIIQDIRSIRINAELLNVPESDEKRKQQVINLATDCVINLRNICYNLTPAELSTHTDGDNTKLELISIIQTLITQFIEKTHVPCSMQIDENFSYPVYKKETTQNLFRIIQEALNNIEKHSYATSCSIYIKDKVIDDKKNMIIYISDDGVGCDVNKLLNHRKKLHFGLQNMLERADLIGASIEFRSEQGDGMEIIISIPIEQ